MTATKDTAANTGLDEGLVPETDKVEEGVTGQEQPAERVYEDLTPYAAWKITMAVLAKNGIEGVKLTSQSMYTRASKNVIESYRNSTGTWFFDGAAFAAWLANYVEAMKNGTTRSRMDYDKLAEKYV